MQQPRTYPRSIYLRRAAVLTACLAVVALLAAAYWASSLRLPDPDAADRDGLLRWLALRDLRTETPAIRLTLLHRLQEEFQGQFDPVAVRTQLDAKYGRRVWDNALVLVETWYAKKLDDYRSAPISQRTVFLDETIAEFQQWKDLAALEPGRDSAPPSDSALLELFTRQIAGWKDNAMPERRREITEFDTALRTRWILHTLGLAPGGGA